MRESLKRIWNKASVARWGLNSNDVLLASYPKSGNTWLRFMLAYLTLKVERGEDQEVNVFNISRFCPEIPGFIGPGRCGVVPRFVKTHLEYNKRFGKVLFLVRAPEEVMRSYYLYAKARKLSLSEMSPMGFLKHPSFGLDAWKRHTLSYMNPASTSFEVQVIKYDELKAETAKCMLRITQLLGLNVGDALIEEIINLSSLDRLKEQEENFLQSTVYDKSFRFFGSTRDSGFSFDEEQINFIRENTLELRELIGFDNSL